MSIAILLYLESFFLKLLPLAPVKQNIMLQGSDEEWVFNELQIVLSETLLCMAGAVCLWSLKDAWNIFIFGSLLKLQLLPWNLVFPSLLLTEFFLAFSTFPKALQSKEFFWLKPYRLLTFEGHYVLLHLLQLSWPCKDFYNQGKDKLSVWIIL